MPGSAPRPSESAQHGTTGGGHRCKGREERRRRPGTAGGGGRRCGATEERRRRPTWAQRDNGWVRRGGEEEVDLGAERPCAARRRGGGWLGHGGGGGWPSAVAGRPGMGRPAIGIRDSGLALGFNVWAL